MVKVKDKRSNEINNSSGQGTDVTFPLVKSFKNSKNILFD